MSELGSETAAARPAAGAGWQFAQFRAWREREHPQSNYQIAQPLWRPEWQSQAEGVRDRTRQALKNWEPRLPAWPTPIDIVHLVQVVAELRAKQIGRMLYLADLFRRDSDYSEHRSKRVHLVMLARKAAPSILDFARRRRIQVVLFCAAGDEEGSKVADRKTVEVAAPTEHADE